VQGRYRASDDERMATASTLIFQDQQTVGGAAAAHAGHIDFPCSVAQERFWLLDRLEPGNPSYNVAVRWQLLGQVDEQLLERTWREIIGRHEVLRTRFLELDGKPVQRVVASCAFKLGVVDLTSLTQSERAAEGDRIGLIEARAPFDLGSGPLLRVVLLRFSAEQAIILVTSHQIVCDGWSIGVMAREMGRIYQAVALGMPAEIEPLSIQYGDYAQWQLEWLTQRGLGAESAYWSRQLSGVAPFEVSADRPRPAVPTTNGAIASIVLPRELTNRLQELTAQSGATLFTAAVATLSAVLARYTGKPEVVIGTQVSDRDQVELEPMIGQFVNSLILRNRLDGDPRFTQLLERTGTTISEALEHRNIPIERLLGMVKAGRGGSSSPAVSINFIFQRTFIEDQDYGEFRLIDMPSLPAGAIYDLNFFMIERPIGWRFSCQYNTDQFEAASVERLLGYIQAAMESAVSSPTRRISELRLADPAQREAVKSRLEGAPNAAAPATTVGELITVQARATPNAIALEGAGDQFTFAQLESESERVARLLRSRGVHSGSRVALLFPRSPELAIAILGTWKAGAAFVTLDVNAPPEQRQQLIVAAGATATLTPADLGGNARAPTSSQSATATPSSAAVWLKPRDDGGQLAIEVSHGALCNILLSLRERLPATGAEVFLSSGAVVAERLTLELLLPLIRGARALLVDADEAVSAAQRARATTIIATPENCSQLLEPATEAHKIPRILCERAAFGTRTLARLLAGSNELWTLQSYAATCGFVSLRRIENVHDIRFLGAPLANTRLRVLDANLAPTPLDAFGELCIGGNLGTVTAAADAEGGHFVYVPGEAGRDELLFRTGEAARIRADGVVEISDREPGCELPEPQAQSAEEQQSVDLQLEAQLRQIWAQLLNLDAGSIDEHANFFELGGHSLLAARMLTRVEAQCGRRVTLAALFRAPSIRGLAQLVRSDAREFDFRQVVKLQSDGANVPLIAVNNTGIYYMLAKRLGPQQPVTSLQVFDPSAPQEGLPQSLEQVAAEYVKLIRRAHPSGPYVLAGWCVAGALAFEIARQMSAAGAQVSEVFLIDSWAPGYFTRLAPLTRFIGWNSLRWQLARDDWRRFRSGEHTWPQFIERRATLRGAWRLWKKLTGQAGRTSRVAAANAQELHDKWLLEYLRTLTDRYEPKSYSGHITLFRSTREPTGWLFDPLAGWGRFASTSGVTLEMIEGDHYTMFQDPGAAQMARRMAPLIETP
jgi:non-ribosomal peptide synthetase component F/thioesterase domain-containing protein/acyl carrier protein